MDEQELLRECPDCKRRPGIEAGTMYCRFCGGQIVTSEEAVALWEITGPQIAQDSNN